jgi:hypothetical protein
MKMSDHANANAKNTVTEEDLRCAEFARAALFPKRMHRDVAHANHFPALVQLDLLRDYYLPHSTVSAIFPRHVVVVPNVVLAAADNGSSKIQWNGVPDIDTATASFNVIPGKISVRCTSGCSTLLNHATQRAFVERRHQHHHHHHNHKNPNDIKDEEEIQIVLCTDRILKKDHLHPNYTGVAKELPPNTMQAVEEVLAHQLAVKVQQNTKRTVAQPTSDNGYDPDPIITAATIQLLASQVSECYFSRHAAYNDNNSGGSGGGGDTSTKKQQHPPQQIKQGSRLPMGYSWLPSIGGWNEWALQRCTIAVATEQLQYSSSSALTFPTAISATTAAAERGTEPPPTVLSKALAQAAVQKALQQMQQQR